LRKGKKENDLKHMDTTVFCLVEILLYTFIA